MDAKYMQNPSHDIFHTSVKYNAVSETNDFANGKIYVYFSFRVSTEIYKIINFVCRAQNGAAC